MIGHRLRRMRGDGDRGLALIFTLLVTTMVTAGVAATLTITTPNIVASKNSQDVSAALLAAQSGIQDAIAYLTNIPACRSETRICQEALGADSNSPSLHRPTLGTDQTFHWTTAPTVVPFPGDQAAAPSDGQDQDGYVRVTSVGTEDGVSRTLVADLALTPSILSYGYYSDFESLTPSFIDSFYGKRNIYVTDTGWLNSGYGVSSNASATINWNGAANGPSAYSDKVCNQHWYADSNGAGRANATHQSTWEETGTLNGYNLTDAGTCDLVFTAGMTENGPTYTRDALDIANGNGNGPIFNKPVDTLWGYSGKNTPAAPTGAPWRQADGTGYDTLSGSPYKPAVADEDITLPTTIGTDGVETNSCVYYGPTRVVLNGTGTATITSPDTTAAVTGADSGCYPTTVSQGIYNYTYNYDAVGAGTIYVKNGGSSTPPSWPTTSLTATTTPASNNEVFWVPATGGTMTDPSPSSHQNSSGAPSSTCSSSNKYSATAGAQCAWTGVASNTDATSSTGWTAYSSGTKCSSVSTTSTDRQAFECDYAKEAGSSSTPNGKGYAAVLGQIQSGITGGSCATDTLATQATCLSGLATTAFGSINTSTYRYVPSASVGTTTTSTSTVGNVPTSAVSKDSFFTTTAATETKSVTPITVTVGRQTYNSQKRTWSTSVPQFTYTSTQTSWAFAPASSASYFPSTQDVTPYGIGSTASGAAAGASGADQPGDLYVQGQNEGPLSLIAQDNVELTGDITKGAGQDMSESDPVSITAGNDIRNYHPVSCVDQNATDINNTSPGWCPNDLTGTSETAATLNSDGSLATASPAAQYSNINGTGDRTIDAALFTLTGSLRTDNYDRGAFVGNLVVNGGVYQSHRGANGVTWTSGKILGHSGTSLNYNYVDLERADLQYVPNASYSSNPRVWNLVSVSDGQ